jgi:hypothetical protein
MRTASSIRRLQRPGDLHPKKIPAHHQTLEAFPREGKRCDSAY